MIAYNRLVFTMAESVSASIYTPPDRLIFLAVIVVPLGIVWGIVYIIRLTLYAWGRGEPHPLRATLRKVARQHETWYWTIGAIVVVGLFVLVLYTDKP